VRIYKQYGDQAVELVRSTRTGWRRHLGSASRRPTARRAPRHRPRLAAPRHAALRYVLQQLSGEGHVGYPEDGVIDRTAELTGIGREVVVARWNTSGPRASWCASRSPPPAAGEARAGGEEPWL